MPAPLVERWAAGSGGVRGSSACRRAAGREGPPPGRCLTLDEVTACQPSPLSSVVSAAAMCTRSRSSVFTTKGAAGSNRARQSGHAAWLPCTLRRHCRQPLWPQASVQGPPYLPAARGQGQTLGLTCRHPVVAGSWRGAAPTHPAALCTPHTRAAGSPPWWQGRPAHGYFLCRGEERGGGPRRS